MADQEVTAAGWQVLTEEYQRLITTKTGHVFPQDVREQLRLVVEAVFRSWNNPRAGVYRRAHQIPDDLGTAVNIQAMVFGNFGEDSGTGVLFTRNPSTGEREIYGEYLVNAQGEDVVAGARTPQSVINLEKEWPQLYAELIKVSGKLEQHYREMQDIEFTVEKGRLYILQTRAGKRTASAALRIAVDLADEGMISREEAIMRIDPRHLDQLLHQTIDAEAHDLPVLARGLPASPGAVAGQVVFSADQAEAWARAGSRVILVRGETTPEDIHGVIASAGVLTSRGGMTSHAAVVARGMGKPCVCGCEALNIEQASLQVGETTIAEGDWLTIDGSTGEVLPGVAPMREAAMTESLARLLGWADEIRRLRVLANADTPQDAETARQWGAEGIGLCRTEHMFLMPERLPVVQRMILASDSEERAAALRELLPMQQADFIAIFRVMDGLPVTIRLLDPPLHEFLPRMEDLLERRSAGLAGSAAAEAAAALPVVSDGGGKIGPGRDGATAELDALIRRVRELQEANPMLGQRGCRLGIVLPDIYEMQVEAIFRAVKDCLREGIDVRPQVMVPLVGHVNELRQVRAMIERVAERVLGEDQHRCPYRVGTMIEVPRAALTAGQIALYADFFSFGTNDLTQMTFGYSRDDAEGKFLTHYVDQRILPNNPFQVLDTEGVGQLIEIAVQRGRSSNPDLHTGICGEHGGDKSSIFYCHRAGLDDVSCSAYRIPVARIAAAQAQIVLGSMGNG